MSAGRRRERREQRLSVSGLREQLVDLVGHLRQRGLERDPAQALALAQPRDVLRDALRHRLQARERVARVGLGAHGEVLHHRRQLELHAVLGRQHARVQRREALEVDGQLRLLQREVVRDAVLAGERVAVDAAQRLEPLALVLLAPGDGLGRGVGEAVVVAMVAERRRALGVLLHLPLPLVVEQRAKARRLERGVEAARVAGGRRERALGGGRHGCAPASATARRRTRPRRTGRWRGEGHEAGRAGRSDECGTARGRGTI